eukprot:1153698-Pelagomonas_calceolata.AAC.1
MVGSVKIEKELGWIVTSRCYSQWLAFAFLEVVPGSGTEPIPNLGFVQVFQQGTCPKKQHH